jgi:hypothetical protein
MTVGREEKQLKNIEIRTAFDAAQLGAGYSSFYPDYAPTRPLVRWRRVKGAATLRPDKLWVIRRSEDLMACGAMRKRQPKWLLSR